MKRITIYLLAIVSMAASAQNVQALYDFGRGSMTTTIEMFKPDEYGNTFFFVDYDYGKDAPSSTYFEIARCFSVWKNVSAQIEYNGGTFANHAALAGFDIFFPAGSAAFNVKALYKWMHGCEQAIPMQLTGVWSWNSKRVTFSGFVDVWWERAAVALSEPQVWLKICKHADIGGEIELSYNFAGNAGFMCNPCAALRWRF